MERFERFHDIRTGYDLRVKRPMIRTKACMTNRQQAFFGSLECGGLADEVREDLGLLFG